MPSSDVAAATRYAAMMPRCCHSDACCHAAADEKRHIVVDMAMLLRHAATYATLLYAISFISLPPYYDTPPPPYHAY